MHAIFDQLRWPLLWITKHIEKRIHKFYPMTRVILYKYQDSL